MEPVAVSWLIASSSSPLVAVLALWTVYVFHTYRRRWRTVDLFLLAITSQGLVISIFTFCYAIIRLINPPFRAPCNFTQWGLVATRTFQVATLTSMVVDRALTVRWPYRYRFSVRRNQIRYHIAVLALVSILVGVAAVFARLPRDDKHCYLHPAQWDMKYVIFLLSLYGVLMLVSFICMIQVEIYRSRHGTKLGANGSFQLPECASPDLPSATGMNSPLDTQSSTGSTRALHRPSRQASRRPYGKNSKSTSDLRWPSVALTSLLCFSLNHIPHLVLMSMAAWNPYWWSPWHEAILTWLGLLEGVFVPLLLFCKDHALRSALRRTFQRRSGALSPLVGDDGPFQMYFDKDHFRKRGTFGSVTPIGIITNYRRTPGKKRRGRKGGSGKYTLPGLHGGDSVLAKSCFSAGFLGSEPLSKLSCADLTSLEMWREEDEENFYATLSDDFSTFSCKSADDSALSEDIRISEELYGGSFTTIANDDFEFHDTRPCGGEVKMKPALTSTPPRNNSFNGGFSRNVSFKENSYKEKMSVNPSYERARDLFNFKDHPEENEQKDPTIFAIPPPPTEENNVSTQEIQQTLSPRDSSNKFGTMSRHQKATSYSMNDLDLIHHGGGQRNEFETTFVLPVKSESTMSLYRLNVERDLDQMIMSPSKSETNVNGDSGFGSGAQSTNPVWSGFLCRKPSDPFWNMRKPTAAVTPTRNYPGILHPRMRKIPWISAWKKLDENSDYHNRHPVKEQNKEDKLGWKDNIVYTSKTDGGKVVPHENIVMVSSTIEEELSDVGTPIFNGDYNLNIFAKESGVLLENAYGKIVRDDCGVKVNFYGENVHYDGKDNIYGNKDATDNIFESSFESDKPSQYDRNHFNYVNQGSKIENHYQPLNGQCINNAVKENIYSRPQAVENMSREQNNSNDLYKCELRLNGGHYENLFGTKENIFAQCDQYMDRNKIESNKGIKMERKCSDKRDRDPTGNANGSFIPAETIYGQLKKVEREESFRNKPDKFSEIHTKDLSRKESDNRGKKCGIKRRESKNRYDKRPDIPIFKEPVSNSNFTEFDNKARYQSNCDKNKIEIEMKNVCGKNDLNCNSRPSRAESERDNLRCNLSRRESQNRRIRDSSSEHKGSKYDRSDNQIRYDDGMPLGNEKRVKIDRRESQNRGKGGSRDRKQNSEPVRQVEFKEGPWLVNVERKDSGRCDNSELRQGYERRDGSCQANLERKDSGRQDDNLQYRKDEYGSAIIRRDSQNRKNAEARNEGLWVNAIPFHAQNQNCDKEEENGNSVRRESRKEAYDLHRSPRKSNLPRKGSKNRNDRLGEHVKRKVSGSRSKKEKYCMDSQDSPKVGNKLARKEYSNRSKANELQKPTQQQNNDMKNDSHFDDFIKYRDKCEDNFSHIQNLNRETSAEREISKTDHQLLYGKLNGNLTQNGEAFAFDTFHQHVAKPAYDVNDNCRQKKLAITDFL